MVAHQSSDSIANGISTLEISDGEDPLPHFKLAADCKWMAGQEISNSTPCFTINALGSPSEQMKQLLTPLFSSGETMPGAFGRVGRLRVLPEGEEIGKCRSHWQPTQK
jgi:hypothetical protein